MYHMLKQFFIVHTNIIQIFTWVFLNVTRKEFTWKPAVMSNINTIITHFCYKPANMGCQVTLLIFVLYLSCSHKLCFIKHNLCMIPQHFNQCFPRFPFTPLLSISDALVLVIVCALQF